MFRGFPRRFVACALAIAFPMAIFAAETGAAAAVGNGKATVNGRALQNNQSISSGDRLLTGEQGRISVSGPGVLIDLSGSTSATYRINGIDVGSGVVRVSTKKGYNAQFKSLSVRPAANGQVQYVVGELNGVATIAALHGSLTVSDGTHSTLVPEGSAVQQEQTTPDTTGKSEKSKKKRGGAVAAGSSIPGWVTVTIIGGAIAGTLGGLAATGYFSKHDVSPATP